MIMKSYDQPTSDQNNWHCADDRIIASTYIEQSMIKRVIEQIQIILEVNSISTLIASVCCDL